jgi:hypothetical protein
VEADNGDVVDPRHRGGRPDVSLDVAPVARRTSALERKL